MTDATHDRTGDIATAPDASPAPFPKPPSDWLRTLALSWWLSPSETADETVLDAMMRDRAEAEDVDLEALIDWASEEKDRRGWKHADTLDEPSEEPS